MAKKEIEILEEKDLAKGESFKEEPIENYVALVNVNKFYDKRVHAVTDFNMEIAKHEFIVFVGPSGCGKSTTLRMIAGLEEISSGELYIDGVYSNDLTPKDRDIAMVFQNYALYPNMTVFGNMAYSIRNRKTEMPIFEPNPEIDGIKDENDVLWADVHKIDRELKKNPENLTELISSRQEKIKAIFANNEKIEALRKPVLGRDTRHIAILNKEIALMEKELISLRGMLEQAKEEGNQSEISKLEVALSQKEEALNAKKTKVEFLSSNDVPLTELRRLRKDELETKINKAADTIGLSEYLLRRPGQLSGGQRQRVALGRAIVRDARVFLMDEPLSNLDAKLRVQMRSQIIRLTKAIKATTIYVTHDQVEAMTMADRIVVMKDGFVQQIGTPIEIYRHPSNKFVASFIGSPAMNFATGTLKDDTLRFDDGFKIALDPELKKKHDSFYKNELQVQMAELENAIAKYNTWREEDIAKHKRLANVPYNVEDEVEVMKIRQNIASIQEIIAGKEHLVTFGVRPEDIKSGKGTVSVKAKINLSELLGDEYYVHFDFGGVDFLAKISSDEEIVEGKSLEMNMNDKKFHLFDEVTGKAIA